jgi:hypothetical protein
MVLLIVSGLKTTLPILTPGIIPGAAPEKPKPNQGQTGACFGIFIANNQPANVKTKHAAL